MIWKKKITCTGTYFITITHIPGFWKVTIYKPLVIVCHGSVIIMQYILLKEYYRGFNLQ